MTRAIPPSKTVTVWQGARREWYQRRDAAYYSLAKELVLKKYPRWLGDANLEDRVDADHEDTIGDVNAEAHAELLGVASIDWRSLRDRRERLFYRMLDAGYPEQSYGFDDRRWRVVVRRLARFMAFVDDRNAAGRAALAQALGEFTRLYKRGPLHSDEIAVVDRRAATILSETNDKKPGTLPARRTP